MNINGLKRGILAIFTAIFKEWMSVMWKFCVIFVV